MKVRLLTFIVLALAATGCAARPTAVVTTTTDSARGESHFSAVTAPIARESTSFSSTREQNVETVEIAGFTAYLSRAAQKHTRRDATLAVLKDRLETVVATFPASSRDDLRRTPIWFTERKTEAPLFHPDAGNGTAQLPSPELSNAIEVPSMNVLFEHLEESHTASSHSRLANLLAAGYFMHLAAPPWKEAEEAFAIAKTNLMTAKLGSDPLSYFSALSSAYFGRWSLPPDREALRSTDPRGVDLVTRTWLVSSSSSATARR